MLYLGRNVFNISSNHFCIDIKVTLCINLMSRSLIYTQIQPIFIMHNSKINSFSIFIAEFQCVTISRSNIESNLEALATRDKIALSSSNVPSDIQTIKRFIHGKQTQTKKTRLLNVFGLLMLIHNSFYVRANLQIDQTKNDDLKRSNRICFN